MPSDKQTYTTLNFGSIAIGRLGASLAAGVGGSPSMPSLVAAQIDMIERRILRIEMLLRRAGIEPESLELPHV